MSALDATQYFCTVGSDIAEEFGQGSVVGETVRLEHALHRVVGVVGRVDGTQRTVDVNRSVFVPIEGGRRLTPKATLRDVVVRRARETDYREVMHQIREYFQAVVPNNTTPVLIAPSSRPRASPAASTGPRAGSMSEPPRGAGATIGISYTTSCARMSGSGPSEKIWKRILNWQDNRQDQQPHHRLSEGLRELIRAARGASPNVSRRRHESLSRRGTELGTEIRVLEFYSVNSVC